MRDDKLPADGAPSLERRLSTILVADVFGYSRMMQVNEERTVEIFRGHREIFDGLLRQHHGRIFNTAGDAVLAEFPSAVEAVRCAAEIQTALRTRNDHLPPEQRMFFRIGINLGDVIVQGNDLLGDGVNVAARIQTIAEPGGICLSGSVYDQIRNKLSMQFKQLGEKSFKNIAEPIRTFSITDVGDGSLPSIPTWRRYAKQRLVAAGICAIVLIAAVGGYWAYRTHDTQRIEEARIAAEAESKRTAADQARMNVEAQRKAELERTARDAVEREAKLRAELLTAKGKAEQERIAREAAQRESKLQVEQERIAREAAQREAKLQAELKAAQVELQQAEAAKKQATQQAPVTAALPKKTASSTDAGPDRYDGIYQGQLCTQVGIGTSEQICRPVKVTVKKGTVSGSWFSKASGKHANLKGTVAPDGTMKLVVEAFNQKGKPISCVMTGTWSGETITTSGKWHHNGNPVKVVWIREP